MILPQLLKTYRESRGLSLVKFAKEVGVQYDALYRFESGKPVQPKHWLAIIRWVFS